MWMNLGLRAGLLAVLWCFAGCATTDEPTTAFSSTFVNLRAYRVVPRRNGDAVELFTTGRPSRRFIEVGIITIRDWTYPRVVWFARDRAAKAGCDALIQTESGSILNAVRPGFASPTPEYHTIARFTCVVWAQAALHE